MPAAFSRGTSRRRVLLPHADPPSTHTNTHTHFTALCQGLPRWASTRKVKPIWILLKQETVSGSGISWAICKSAPHSRQTTTPAPHHSVFYRPDALIMSSFSKENLIWPFLACKNPCHLSPNVYLRNKSMKKYTGESTYLMAQLTNSLKTNSWHVTKS